MAVDVVGARLGVVLDDEDAGLLPLRAPRHRLHHPPERQVVVGHHGARARVLGVGPLGVVAWQAHDHQLGHLVPAAEFIVFTDEHVGAKLVALEQRPVVDLAVDQRLQAHVERLRDMMKLPSLEEIFRELVVEEDTERLAKDIVAVMKLSA